MEYTYSYVHELNQTDSDGRVLGSVQVSSKKSGSTNYGGADDDVEVSQPDSTYVFRARLSDNYYSRVPAYAIKKSDVKAYIAANDDDDKTTKASDIADGDITVDYVKAAIAATDSNGNLSYSLQMTSDNDLTILENCGFSKVLLKDGKNPKAVTVNNTNTFTYLDDTNDDGIDETITAGGGYYYVQYYAVDFQTLAYNLYGNEIISTDNRDSDDIDETDNRGEYFQLDDMGSSTAEAIYTAFVTNNAFSDVQKDDSGNVKKVNDKIQYEDNHKICYQDTSKMSKYLLKYVWKVKKTESYVADARASGWQNWEKKDSWTKSQKNKKKKLPSSNGGSISEDGTTFATTKIKKVALATSVYSKRLILGCSYKIKPASS
jgi:hypothetical protein